MNSKIIIMFLEFIIFVLSFIIYKLIVYKFYIKKIKQKNNSIQVSMKPLLSRRRKSKEELVKDIVIISSHCNYINCDDKHDLFYKYGGFFCIKHLTIISNIRLKIYLSKDKLNIKNELKYRIEEILVRKYTDRGHFLRVCTLSNELLIN